MCAGCKSVWYCGPACQKKDWKEHRPDCKAIRKERKEKGEQVKLICMGIDKWNRPGGKGTEQKAFYGSVDELFSYGATEEEVLKKVDIYGLCYFGDHFGCEPMGTSIPDKYII